MSRSSSRLAGRRPASRPGILAGKMMLSLWLGAALSFGAPAPGAKQKTPKAKKPAAAELKISLQGTDNVFSPDQDIQFQVDAKNLPNETLTATVVDYFGQEVWHASQPVPAGGKVTLDLGQPGNGYYELKVQSTVSGAPGLSGHASFGVAPLMDRTAEAARAAGSRFGLKMGGAPRGFDSLKAMSVAARLGLQWTRELFSRDDISALGAMPVNIIYKVEGIPEEAYDAARYGPMADFHVRHFNWQKATVPLEEPYKKWLKEKVATLPKNNTVFEIWNEPWGKMPATDFARIAQWACEAILEVRPDAQIGPNLGHIDYDADFIAAGGMKGMTALVLHTYGHPERSDVRATVRRLHDFYKEKTGRDIDFYATEFGSASPPEGPATSDHPEQRQAMLGVRTALALYAEDVKGFMPHWLAQNESDPRNKEDWYGYFRANQEPKPALFAMATAARLIDRSVYVGDLFLKPDVGARLFKRDNQYTLVLWTNDLAIPVQVDVGEKSVTKVNVVGQSSPLPTDSGKLDLSLTGDPIYLVGVNPSVAASASTALRDDQWPTGKFVRVSRDAHFMKTPPLIDGKIDPAEWAGQTAIPLSNDKVAKSDASATGYVAWDHDYLYIAVEVTDNHPGFNTHPSYSAYDGDSFELFVGSDIKFQIPEFLHDHDYHFLFSTTAADGKPVAGVLNTDAGHLDPIPGLKMASAVTATGWTLELAIPLSSMKDFTPVAGHKAALEMRINDADPDRPNRLKIDPADGGNPSHFDATLWSLLILKD